MAGHQHVHPESTTLSQWNGIVYFISVECHGTRWQYVVIGLLSTTCQSYITCLYVISCVSSIVMASLQWEATSLLFPSLPRSLTVYNSSLAVVYPPKNSCMSFRGSVCNSLGLYNFHIPHELLVEGRQKNYVNWNLWLLNGHYSDHMTNWEVLHGWITSAWDHADSVTQGLHSTASLG